MEWFFLALIVIGLLFVFAGWAYPRWYLSKKQVAKREAKRLDEELKELFEKRSDK